MPHVMQYLPRPGIEPIPSALGAQSLNHWTTREVPLVKFKMNKNGKIFKGRIQIGFLITWLVKQCECPSLQHQIP